MGCAMTFMKVARGVWAGASASACLGGGSGGAGCHCSRRPPGAPGPWRWRQSPCARDPAAASSSRRGRSRFRLEVLPEDKSSQAPCQRSVAQAGSNSLSQCCSAAGWFQNASALVNTAVLGAGVPLHGGVPPALERGRSGHLRAPLVGLRRSHVGPRSGSGGVRRCGESGAAVTMLAG